MPSYLDLGVLGVVFVSALLSMMRGFTREVLAIGSWVAAAAAAYYLHPKVMPYLESYIHKPAILQAAAAAIVFFATLVVVSLITVRLSDAILDSKIGALDRSLGFVFGAARGFLLAVVAFAIFNWLVGDKQQPGWVQDAKTRPMLVDTANRIVAMLPEDAATQLETMVKSKMQPSGADAPADEARPGAADANPAPAPTRAASPAPAPARIVAPSPSPSPKTAASDREKLDALINSRVALPPPAPTPGKP
jgi:membrane protein required for colicin V production